VNAQASGAPLFRIDGEIRLCKCGRIEGAAEIFEDQLDRGPVEGEGEIDGTSGRVAVLDEIAE
jgi:hypothetical protein